MWYDNIKPSRETSRFIPRPKFTVDEIIELYFNNTKKEQDVIQQTAAISDDNQNDKKVHQQKQESKENALTQEKDELSKISRKQENLALNENKDAQTSMIQSNITKQSNATSTKDTDKYKRIFLIKYHI